MHYLSVLMEIESIKIPNFGVDYFYVDGTRKSHNLDLLFFFFKNNTWMNLIHLNRNFLLKGKYRNKKSYSCSRDDIDTIFGMIKSLEHRD